jgi:cytochrome c-type biogenesis protein
LNQIPPKDKPNQRWTTFGHALLFVLGFSLVFIIGWGGAATAIGQLFGDYKILISRIGGVLVIIFGLFTLQILPIPWLNYDTRPQWIRRKENRWISSILMGIFFAAGWTPCIGPTLGAILTLGMSQQGSSQAMILASGYALGLGIPFLIIGLGMDRALHILARFKRHLKWIEVVTGVFLIGLGVLMVTGRMAWLYTWFTQFDFSIDLPFGSVVTPSYFIAMAGGLLSFLSPCVLPLVPIYIGYLSGIALWEEGEG